jgi:hypothetical protein
MVCFTEHEFNFSKDNAEIWFPMLCKYYENVEMTVKIKGKNYCGKASLEWFTSLPKAEEYHFKTNRFWSESAAIQTLPRFTPSNEAGSLSTDVSSAIDELIKKRLSMGCLEVMLQVHHDVDWKDIVTSIGKLKETKDITRMFITNSAQTVILVLNDRHTIFVTPRNISDGSLPIFDIDDGFAESSFGSFIPDEFTIAFNIWKSKFLESSGKSWNDPIFNSCK